MCFIYLLLAEMWHCYGLLVAQIWQTGAVHPNAIIPRHMWTRSSSDHHQITSNCRVDTVISYSLSALADDKLQQFELVMFLITVLLQIKCLQFYIKKCLSSMDSNEIN